MQEKQQGGNREDWVFVSADRVLYMITLFERKAYVICLWMQTKDDKIKLNKDAVGEFAVFVK